MPISPINPGDQILNAVLSDPSKAINAFAELVERLDSLCHHTGYDACQDILDAVEHGHLSHAAALQAIAVLMADMERRGQKSAAPQPAAPRPQPTTPQAALSSWAGGELGLEAVADWLRTH